MKVLCSISGGKNTNKQIKPPNPEYREKNWGKILLYCGVEVFRAPLASEQKDVKVWEARDICDFHHLSYSLVLGVVEG